MSERTPEEIQEDIEETRSEMGETIDAIQDRVSPENVKESIRHETVDRARAAADQASARVRASGSRLAERAQPALEKARSQAKPYADQAQVRLKRGQTRFQQLQEENPALAYGLVAGIVATVILLIWLAFRRD